MKKLTKITAIILTAVFIFSITAFAKDYSDYPQKFYDLPKNHWAFEYISELVDKGVINGYEDGSFRPDNTVLRAEWAKIMVLAAGLPLTTDLDPYGAYFWYTDLDPEAWYAPYMATAARYMNYWLEMVTPSDSMTLYKPNQAASREDVTVAMVKLKGYDINNVDYSYLNSFTDQNSISNDCKKYVAVAVGKGLINGFEDNTFRGQDTLTRAEAATLLWRAFQMGNDNKVVDGPVNGGNNSGVTNPTSSKTPEPTQNPSDNNNNGDNKQEENNVTDKAWKVETLAKINVIPNGSYNVNLYVQNDDNLYCVDENNNIIKIDLLTRNMETVIQGKNIEIEYNDENYTVSKINQIYYDSSRNTIAIYADFISKNVMGNSTQIRYILVSIPNCEVLGANANGKGNVDFIDGFILGTNDNEDIIAWNSSLSGLFYYESPAFLYKDMYSQKGRISNFKAINMIEINNNYYFSYFGSFYKYDFNNINQIGKTIDRMSASTITKNGIYIIGQSCIGLLDLEFNDKTAFTVDDIEIKDKLSLNFQYAEYSNLIGCRLIVSSKEDIIFYDYSAKAFRIISKND